MSVRYFDKPVMTQSGECYKRVLGVANHIVRGTFVMLVFMVWYLKIAKSLYKDQLTFI
jgi:hypothetical protein